MVRRPVGRGLVGLTLAVAALATAGPARGQTTTSFYWSFASSSAAVSSVTPAANPAISNSATAVFGIGNTNGSVTALSATSVSSGYAGASGGVNIGNAVFSGGLNIATSSYYTVTLSVTAGTAFTFNSLNFGARSTTTGPLAYSLRSSVDSFASDLVAPGSIANNSTWSFKTNAATSGAAGGTVTTVADQDVEFRLYTYGGANAVASSMNSKLDDITLSVTTTPVPEPTTALAISVAGLGAVRGLRRRNRL